MGVHHNISADKFPKQGRHLKSRVTVFFNYGPPSVEGTIVRDDNEEPFVTIIMLDDGRYVLATECQYSPK